MRSYAPASGKNFASRSGRDFKKETKHAEIIAKTINDFDDKIIMSHIRTMTKLPIYKIRKMLLVLKNHRKINAYCSSSVSGFNKYRKIKGMIVTIEDVKEASTY